MIYGATVIQLLLSFTAYHFVLCNKNFKNFSKVIGIFSICENETNRTQTHHMASAFHYLAITSFTTPCVHYKCYNDGIYNKTEYKYFDVCTNRNLLQRVALDLLLDEQYNVYNEIPDGNRTVKIYPNNKIACVIVYLEFELIEMLKNIMAVNSFDVSPLILPGSE